MRQKKVINKKVRNATPLTYNGIAFKSKLEVYCYKKLKESNLEFTYEGVTFELVPSFTFENNSYELYRLSGNKYFGPQRPHIRAITYTPDFVGDGWIIETKGNPNETFPIKFKLFKYYLQTRQLNVDLYVPRNHKQIDEVITIIKTKNEGILRNKKSK